MLARALSTRILSRLVSWSTICLYFFTSFSWTTRSRVELSLLDLISSYSIERVWFELGAWRRFDLPPIFLALKTLLKS